MSRAESPRFFELTGAEWAVLALIGVLTVALLASLRPDVTLWPALGLGVTTLVVGHMCMTVRRFVSFPDLIAAAACLQWVIAPWLAESYPPDFFLFRMALGADEYLQYAVPATVALWVGLHLPASRRLAKTWDLAEAEPLAPSVRRTLDAAIVLGLLVDGFSRGIPAQWAFLAYLLASLRFVGALGWMVTRTPGWPLRVAIVMIHLAAVQSSGGLFYLVIHWGGYFLLVYGFMMRWRWRMAVALLMGMVGLSLLQGVKPTFRISLVEQEVSGPVEAFTRLMSMLYEQARQGHIVDPSVRAGDFLVRFNQGWIVARVMTHVPSEEPYALGETLVDALVFSVVPRFLVPSKRDGTSRELFARYTGVRLSDNTRMGLGIIGEMYANFGRWGGIAAVFVYGLAMGWLFLFFAERAQKNPLWWAAASTVLLPGVEPGFNLEDIANHVVKATVLFFILWKTVGPLKGLLALPDVQTGAYAYADHGSDDLSPVIEPAAADR